MIEEGHPHLERARHARGVRVAEQALAEEAPQLEHGDRRQRAAAGDQLVELPSGLARQPHVDLAVHAALEELPGKIGGEERVRDLVGVQQLTPGGERVAQLAPARLRRQRGAESRGARDGVRQAAQQTRGEGAQPAAPARRAGDPAEARIAAEQLVSSGPRQGDGEAGFAHRAADEVGVDPVEGRLVEAGERVGKLPAECALGQPQLVVFGSERPRDRARVRRFVVDGLLESDVEGTDAGASGAHRERGDGA